VGYAFQDGGQLLFASITSWVYELAPCSPVKQNQMAANKQETVYRIKNYFLNIELLFFILVHAVVNEGK